MINFTNSAFLWATLAVGIPVLIHLMTRRRSRLIEFPAVRYLREAAAGRQRLHRLRTALVLGFRCLAFAALVLLFTRPFFEARKSSDEIQARQRIAVVIDATFSMQQIIGGVSLFDRAKTETADLLRGLPAGTEVVILIAGAGVHSLLPTLSANIPALHRRLAQVAPTMAHGSLSDATADAFRRLGNAGSVYVFSDFQLLSWQDAALAPPEGISVYLRPVADQPAENLAVTRVAVSPSFPVVNEPVILEATVLNGTDKPLQETLILKLADEARRKRVRLDPFETGTVRFRFTLPGDGQFAGLVKLSRNDALDADNTRYFSVQARAASTVLIVSDQNPQNSAAAPYYLAAAVAPFQKSGSGTRAVCRHSQDLDAAVIDAAQVFVLYPPATLAPETAALIYHRVAGGAGLLTFLDGSASSELINLMHSVSNGRMAPPFEPGPFLEPGPNGGHAWVDINYGRKPLKVFKQAANRGLAKIRVRRYFRTLPFESDGGDILASYADGSSALAATSVGSGRVLWANFPVIPDRSNLAASPLLPALIHECIAFFGDSANDNEGRPGKNWEIILPRADSNLIPRVVAEDGRVIESQTISLGDRRKLSIQPPAKPGLYQIRDNDGLITRAVVNIDSRESDPRRIAAEDLVVTLVKKESRTRAVTNSDREIEDAQTPLWHWAGLGAAIFLLVEMLLLSFWRQPRSGI